MVGKVDNLTCLAGLVTTEDPARVRALRGTVLVVALLNGAYLVVEIILALGIGSVALVADSVDFFEDFAVNLLIFVALG